MLLLHVVCPLFQCIQFMSGHGLSGKTVTLIIILLLAMVNKKIFQSTKLSENIDTLMKDILYGSFYHDNFNQQNNTSNEDRDFITGTILSVIYIFLKCVLSQMNL